MLKLHHAPRKPHSPIAISFSDFAPSTTMKWLDYSYLQDTCLGHCKHRFGMSCIGNFSSRCSSICCHSPIRAISCLCSYSFTIFVPKLRLHVNDGHCRHTPDTRNCELSRYQISPDGALRDRSSVSIRA